MPPGTDGDDEELVEIDVEIDGPPPVPRELDSDGIPRSAPESGSGSAPELIADAGDTEPNRGVAPAEGPPPAPPDILEISDAVELQPPIVEAATDDPAAALALYEAEAAAAEGGERVRCCWRSLVFGTMIRSRRWSRRAQPSPPTPPRSPAFGCCAAC